jgi:hypothetical protein
MLKNPRVNPDLDDIADWAKWGYATGTRLISAVQHQLAKLAGTGRLDPDEAMFLQDGLEGIYDALYMGTVSAVRGQDDVLEDDNTYSDGRQVTVKTRNEAADELASARTRIQFLSYEGAVAVHPPGITSLISPPNPGHPITAFGETAFLNHFYEDRG